MTNKQNIHATGILFEGIGVLIRGKSGDGKSLLALALLERLQVLGKSGQLIGDDRIDIWREMNRIIMAGAPTIQGKIELFGYGILDVPFAANCPIHLIVDLVDEVVRFPEQDALSTDLMGLKIPRCPVAKKEIIGLTHQRLIVIEAIMALK